VGRRQLRFVVAWAELHQQELSENWRRARAGETLRPVEPLPEVRAVRAWLGRRGAMRRLVGL
jgi:hypothetical protein